MVIQLSERKDGTTQVVYLKFANYDAKSGLFKGLAPSAHINGYK
jgi:hypothetical protein